MSRIGPWPGLVGMLLVLTIGGWSRGAGNGRLVPLAIPGGVVDPEVRRAFVRGIDGGIDALDVGGRPAATGTRTSHRTPCWRRPTA